MGIDVRAESDLSNGRRTVDIKPVFDLLMDAVFQAEHGVVFKPSLHHFYSLAKAVAKHSV
jgi:hypothetical protein